MTKRGLLVAVALAVVAIVACLLYLFVPFKPEPEWDPSPDACAIGVFYRGEVDINYIPDVQLFGDGHLIWTEYDTSGSRQVWEGYLSEEDMSRLVNQFIDAGFFKRYRSLNWGVDTGSYVKITLSSVRHEEAVDAPSEPNSGSVLDLVNFLKSGAGATGSPFVPTEGTLYAYPSEETGFAGAEASYEWPDEEFGYELEDVYSSAGFDGVYVTGDELLFAWEVVNSPSPLVESGGKVFWIGVEVPKVSSFWCMQGTQKPLGS